MKNQLGQNDIFCNEYKAMLNTNYTKTFNEVINCQL